ncbi:Ubiquitin-associated 1 [Rhynchospora pubera]|uniref:Ubiquitin-associated 1 n=1 Tax=Rhynchospora pubera TaxID=906938 RepID=A0AAV8H2D1_9POAL|nr:Ubiquitin-associated 1 [Rhynchospora pubera]KAJ4809757.1 Ubiquitin-associated 1 [Rhynchospora pubera]
MDYDPRNRGGPMYPRVGPTAPPPPVSAGVPYRVASSSAAGSAPPSSGLGIRVMIKPEYQITPPPQLTATTSDVPRSTFKFDFEFERRILAEAEKENPDWSKFVTEVPPQRPSSSKPPPPTASPLTPPGDPVVEKYVSSGLARDAVAFAVLNYGDNPIKVSEFVKGYNMIREMGFTSKNVAEVLAMYDNDTDKALGHLLNNS